MIQITEDPSAKRTTPPRSTHVQLGRRLLLLDPARGKERLMEIQQHDGVVVEVAGISAGLRQASARGGGVAGGDGGARGCVLAALPPPTIYRDPWGGAGPGRSDLQGGRRPRGKGGGFPPKPSGAPPTPRVSNPRRRGRPMGGAPAHQGLVPFPLQPMGPSGIGGPTRWTTRTLPVVPVQYRLPPKLS